MLYNITASEKNRSPFALWIRKKITKVYDVLNVLVLVKEILVSFSSNYKTDAS